MVGNQSDDFLQPAEYQFAQPIAVLLLTATLGHGNAVLVYGADQRFRRGNTMLEHVKANAFNTTDDGP